MNLTTLRALALEWLDNPAGDLFAPGGNYGRLDRAINTAYERIVSRVSASSQLWNIHDERVSLTVTTASREYDVAGQDANGQPNIRKPIEACRTDTGDEITYSVVPYSTRNTYSRGTARVPTLRNAPSMSVYFYRYATGVWRLGFVDPEPEDQTVEVIYEPTVLWLATAIDVPVQVPVQFHHLIAMHAAVLCMKQNRMDWQHLETELGRGAREMAEELGSVVSTSRSQGF